MAEFAPDPRRDARDETRDETRDDTCDDTRDDTCDDTCDDTRGEPREQHARFEELYANALCSEDPVAALKAAARDESLTDELRAALAAACPDGARIAALLVAKLRFERIINGSSWARPWFEAEPREFTDAFKRYHTSVPPRDAFPSAEANRFSTWVRENGLGAGEMKP